MLPVFIHGGTLDQRLKMAQEYLQGKQLLYELDATQVRESLQEIKNLKHTLSLKAGDDQLAALILESQHLSIPAQNALLKVLEEHDSNLLIILTGHLESAILPTLISRTLQVPIRSDAQDLSCAKSILEQIFHPDLNIAFDLAKDWAQDDPESKLKLLLSIFQSHIHKNPTTQRAKATEMILKSYQDLSTYIPKDFIINHLFLRLRGLKRA